MQCIWRVFQDGIIEEEEYVRTGFLWEEYAELALLPAQQVDGKGTASSGHQEAVHKVVSTTKLYLWELWVSSRVLA